MLLLNVCNSLGSFLVLEPSGYIGMHVWPQNAQGIQEGLKPYEMTKKASHRTCWEGYPSILIPFIQGLWSDTLTAKEVPRMISEEL